MIRSFVPLRISQRADKGDADHYRFGATANGPRPLFSGCAKSRCHDGGSSVNAIMVKSIAIGKKAIQAIEVGRFAFRFRNFHEVGGRCQQTWPHSLTQKRQTIVGPRIPLDRRQLRTATLCSKSSNAWSQITGGSGLALGIVARPPCTAN